MTDTTNRLPYRTHDERGNLIPRAYRSFSKGVRLVVNDGERDVVGIITRSVWKTANAFVVGVHYYHWNGVPVDRVLKAADLARDVARRPLTLEFEDEPEITTQDKLAFLAEVQAEKDRREAVAGTVPESGQLYTAQKGRVQAVVHAVRTGKALAEPIVVYSVTTPEVPDGVSVEHPVSVFLSLGFILRDAPAWLPKARCPECGTASQKVTGSDASTTSLGCPDCGNRWTVRHADEPTPADPAVGFLSALGCANVAEYEELLARLAAKDAQRDRAVYADEWGMR